MLHVRWILEEEGIIMNHVIDKHVGKYSQDLTKSVNSDPLVRGPKCLKLGGWGWRGMGAVSRASSIHLKADEQIELD